MNFCSQEQRYLVAPKTKGIVGPHFTVKDTNAFMLVHNWGNWMSLYPRSPFIIAPFICTLSVVFTCNVLCIMSLTALNSESPKWVIVPDKKILLGIHKTY